ncbi:MAG TPA: type II secretion system F family protein [Tepidisphaeraceae bacterium]|nr:type II secretion system F family protein [Tepidisphaeraceae bacterium]
MDTTTLLSLCTFGFVSFLGMFVFQLVGGKDEQRLRTRLKASDGPAPTAAAGAMSPPASSLMARFGLIAAKPLMPAKREKISHAKQLLASAGIYSPTAIRSLYGLKFIFFFVGLILGDVAGLLFGSSLLFLALGALAGLFIPTVWLRSRIKANQKDLEYGLADALDLMVVCVEAGLTVDSAMQRVGQELVDVHPAISRELGICHMETRIGLSRVEALKNLGTRTASPALQSLAAMLTQAERFGTSIGQALRVHAESLRVARQTKAEEMAAKTSVKLSIPLVLFIFPATFIVLIGPTAIQLMNSPLFKD